MRLFVTGATGFIGRRFCALALERGHSVMALVRPASAGRVPAGVQRVMGSLPYDVPERHLQGCDVIVHLAAITTADRATESTAVNASGTEYLVALAQRCSAKLLFMSTQSAHGGNASAYATTKREGEQTLRSSGIEYAIVRPGLVYGPGDAGLYGRMRAAVRKMPLLPLLGGGKALVQPIHVDDLCAGLLTIVENFDEFRGAELMLGDAVGLSLKEFLAAVARADQRPVRQVTVPVAPLKAAVGAAEKLRLPSPISSDNLRGLETVQRMDTAESLSRLNLNLRPLDEGLAESAAPVEPAKDTRIPVMLVGAGKIGIVHALQLRHSPDMKLACVVDPAEKSWKLYRSMGFQTRFFPDLKAALAAQPELRGAILATPANTHMELAEKCLEAGLHVFTEKPASISDGNEDRWRELHDRFPRLVIHTGYMGAQFPHLYTAFQVLRSQKLGRILRARVVALQTHITAREPVRWEMLRGKSGGGALINFGCHGASMVFRLMGWPDGSIQGWQWPIYSSEVEDAVVARFTVRGAPCTLVVSWSVPGYARPFNLVEVECEQGSVRVENGSVSVIREETTVLFDTQLDYPLNFNMAPDYTGGGFTLEHEAFAAAVRTAEAGKAWAARPTEAMPAVELPEALRLENWIRHVYGALPMEKPSPAQLRAMGVADHLTDLLLNAGEETP